MAEESEFSLGGTEDSALCELRLREEKVAQKKVELEYEYIKEAKTRKNIEAAENGQHFRQSITSFEEFFNDLRSENTLKTEREVTLQNKLHSLRLKNSISEAKKLGELNYALNLDDQKNYLNEQEMDASVEFQYYFPLRNEQNQQFLHTHIDQMKFQYEEAEEQIAEKSHWTKVLQAKTSNLQRDMIIFHSRIEDFKINIKELDKGYKNIVGINLASKSSFVNYYSKINQMNLVSEDIEQFFGKMLLDLREIKEQKKNETMDVHENLANLLVTIEEQDDFLDQQKMEIASIDQEREEIKQNLQKFDSLIPVIESLQELENYIYQKNDFLVDSNAGSPKTFSKYQDSKSSNKNESEGDTSKISNSDNSMTRQSIDIRSPKRFNSKRGSQIIRTSKLQVLHIKYLRSDKKSSQFKKQEGSKSFNTIKRYFERHPNGIDIVIDEAVQLYNEEVCSDRYLYTKFTDLDKQMSIRKKEYSSLTKELDQISILDSRRQLLNGLTASKQMGVLSSKDSGLISLNRDNKFTTINVIKGNQKKRNQLLNMKVTERGEVVMKAIIKSTQCIELLTRYFTSIFTLCKDNGYSTLEVKEIGWWMRKLLYTIKQKTEVSYYEGVDCPVNIKKSKFAQYFDESLYSIPAGIFIEMGRTFMDEISEECLKSIHGNLQRELFLLSHINFSKFYSFYKNEKGEILKEKENIEIAFFKALNKLEKQSIKLFFEEPITEYCEILQLMQKRLDEPISGTNTPLGNKPQYQPSKKHQLTEDYKRMMSRKFITMKEVRRPKKERDSVYDEVEEQQDYVQLQNDQETDLRIDFQKVNLLEIEKNFVVDLILQKKKKAPFSKKMQASVSTKESQETQKQQTHLFKKYQHAFFHDESSGGVQKSYKDVMKLMFPNSRKHSQKLIPLGQQGTGKSKYRFNDIIKDCIYLDKISNLASLNRTKNSNKDIVEMMEELKLKKKVKSGIMPRSSNRIPISFSMRKLQKKNNGSSMYKSQQSYKEDRMTLFDSRTQHNSTQRATIGKNKSFRVNRSSNRLMSQRRSESKSTVPKNSQMKKYRSIVDTMTTRRKGLLKSRGSMGDISKKSDYRPLNPTFRLLSEDPYFKRQYSYVVR